MRSRIRFLLVLIPSVALSPEISEAQSRLMLDVRAGVSIPSGPFTRGPVEGGAIDAAPAFGLHFALRRSRWVDLYAGFSQVRFGCESDGCTGAAELVATAWDLGFHLRPRGGPWGPWLHLGTVLGGVEVDLPGSAAGDGPARQVSDTGIGGEVGLGWRIRLAETLGLSPGIRYTYVNSRLDGDVTFRMRYWVADLGLAVGF